MGCDIHGPFIEVKEYADGSWWTRREFLTDRNYALFGALAGVRAIDIDPPVPPRGLPDDASSEWRSHHDADCHSESWLTVEELRQAQDAYAEEYTDFSNDIGLWVSVMEFYERTIGGAVRIGFCFDN